MKWTTQQQTAISERGRSIIVSAAAGSGKTAVLVERLLDILSNPDADSRVCAENIIVVTFTKDAAAQMKQRLYKAFTEKMEALDNDADGELYSWLLRQQSALSSATIATINSFCFDLVRENADSCHVSAQFRTAEEAEESIYVSHAMQTVLERWSREKHADMETLFSFFCARNDAELESYILSVAEYMKSLAFPEYWAKRAVGICKDSTVLFEAIRSAVCASLERVLDLAKTSQPFAAGAVLNGKKNQFADVVKEDITNIEFHLNFLRTAEMDQLLKSPRLHEVPKFKNMPKETDFMDMDKKITFQQFREIYKDMYKDALKKYLDPLTYFTVDTTAQQRIVPLLIDVTLDYRRELMAEKRRRNVLSFADGEELALQLLGEIHEDGSVTRTALAETLSARYSLIMVDEYQDCNNKQDCLFKLLSAGCTSDANGLHYGNNAFLVGDVKQSIYTFRQANPYNFINALEDSRPLAECDAEERARIYLNQNFRSSEGVIDFVNELFTTLMTKQCGEVDYDANERLNYGAVHYTGAANTMTTCMLTDSSSSETDAQAECIAAQIQKMLDEKVQVLERDGSSRDCCYQDFCILVRSVSKYGDGLLKALRDRGIPAAGEEKHEFLERPEIRLIYNLLRILDNPLTDISAASVMLSPIYGFTAQDLIELKTFSRRKRLYLQVQELADTQDAEKTASLETLRQRCRAFLQSVSRLRNAVEAMPLESLIMHVYDETDLLSLQCLYEDELLRRSNLQAFVRLAQDYRKHMDLAAQCSVSAWLRYLDGFGKKSPDIKALSQTVENSVVIKTIHKSKGLEYPFVFLAHLEKPFSKRPSNENMHLSEEGMIGLKTIDRDNYSKSQEVAYRYLLADVYRKQRSEEMRLFYVALTRAQQQLFLVMHREDCVRFIMGTCDQKKKTTKYEMMAILLRSCPSAAVKLAAEAKSMLEWLLQYLLSCNEAQLLQYALDTNSSCHSAFAAYLVCNAEKAQAIEEEPQQRPAVIEQPVDPDLLVQMQQQLAFRYQSEQSGLVSKYSVTALSHPERNFEGRFGEPSFLHEPKEGRKRALRGAKRGTAVHKMLQYMNFADAAEDTQKELNRLQENGYLNELEAETLAPEKLQAFFASELYQRIAASDQVKKEQQMFVKIGELALPEDSALYRKYAGTDGILIGTMDLLFHEDDGWVLVDYKTDYVRKPEELAEKYSLQLALYQKAAERILGEPVKQAYIYSFTLDCAIELDLDKVEFQLEEQE